MNLLVALRLVSITVFTVFSIVILSTAAWNISVINPNDTFHVSMDAFVMSISAIAVLFILPLIAYDFVRPNAFVTKVWFEIAWLSLFWVFYLAGASALTAAAPEPICSPKNFAACTSAQVLLAFLWLLVTIVLIHLLILLISAIYYSKEHPHVWFATVREFRWFEGGGGGTPTVTPLPHSPVAKGFKPKRFSLQAAPVAPLHPYRDARDAQPLERVAEAHGMTASQWIRHQALQGGERRPPAMSEVSTRPPAMAHTPSYRPAHYTAVTSTRIDGQAQQVRRSSREANNNPAMGLYPTAMNKALDMPRHYRQSSRDAVIPPAPQLNNALGLQTQPSAPPPPPPRIQRQPSVQQAQGYSTYYSSQRSSREPPPIRDWPRPNPQEPLRRNSHKNVAPPYAAPTANPIPVRTHRVAESSSSQERVARRSSSQDSSHRYPHREAARPAGPRPPRPQRHRPPPLDLSRAMPGRR